MTMVKSDAVGITPRARLIAFYLPQFHPIPENDQWWGKGFTEWTNVAKALPLFKGHSQPNLPGELGFYDLRVPEVREAQAQLAREHGIEAFCYWHYYFGNGKRLLERPFNEVLKSGQPKFPFCLAWANQTWSGTWYGCPDKVLMAQDYPGPKDHESHFFSLLEAFHDPRYVTVKGMPLFVIYSPHTLPEPHRFVDQWRELALKNGLNGIYFVGIVNDRRWGPQLFGIDGTILHAPGIYFDVLKEMNRSGLIGKLNGRLKKWREAFWPSPTIYRFEDYLELALPQLARDHEQFPCVVPNWDNTPRSGHGGFVLLNCTPDLFGLHLKGAVEQVVHRAFDNRLIFVKAWNEWAEGNYIEPDQKCGRGYLQAVRRVVLD